MVKQYALIQKAEPFVLSSEDSSDGDAPIAVQSSVRHQLLTLYESYAEAFPNPSLQEENQERDRLIRAISAANHAVQINPQKQKTSGLWNSLFGSKKIENKSSLFDVADDERLVYTDVSNEFQQSHDYLLGTTCSLDSTCIPEEAHSVARLSLVRSLRSSRRQSPSAPKVARTSWETAGSSCIIVGGLGCIVEFQKRSPSPNQDATTNTVDCAGQRQYTSDHSQLLEYFDAKGHGGLLGKRGKWSPLEAVAATVGPNLLVVSWGLGVPVLFYRRVAAPTQDTTDENHFVVSWEAVASVGATQIVRERLLDVFSADGEDSALLSVADLIPLVVEVPNHAPIVTMAVARLGGFVELVPLPPQMWYGSELPLTKKHIRPLSRRKSRGQKRKLGSRSDHFFNGNNLPDLSMNPDRCGGIVVLKTTNYHSDVLGLGAFRTSVDAAVKWNPETHPGQSPPAQYVLAIYGTGNGTEHQTISFWSFSALLSPSAPGGGGFSIYSSFTDAVDLGKVGPDVTLFASPTIFRHWRRPRHVELRESQSTSSSVVIAASTARNTTLSLSVPIVEICFVVTRCHHADGDAATTRAAVLDWNGGVTLLDCTLLEKSVTIPTSVVSDDEASLVYLLADRSVTMKEFSKCMNSCAPIGISSIQWLQGSSRDSASLVLAALTYDPCSLLLLFSPFSSDSDAKALPFNTSVVSCKLSGCGKLSVYQKYKRTICLVVRSASSICFCALQELQSADVVRSLINASKFKEALVMAESLTATERENVKPIVETCKKRLWESELDFSSLSSMIDDSYIVDIALNAHVAKPSQHRDQNFLNDDVVLYRSVCRLAFERMETSRKSYAVSDTSKDIINAITSRLVKLGTYELLCLHLSSKPSLHRFFEDFLPVSLLEFALFLARRADVSALSIIWFRHPKELNSHRLEVLSEIALSTDPRFFQHLLPVLNQSASKYKTFGCFLTGLSPQHVMKYAYVFDYLIDQFNVSLRVDEADQALILEDWKCFESSQCVEVEDVGVLADWFCHRTLVMQDFVSSFKVTLYFARLALRCLRISDSTADSLLPSLPLFEVLSLQQKLNVLLLLIKFLSEGSVDFMRSSLSILERISFDKMDTYDIAFLTMGCKSDTDDILDQYNRYLLPMVKVKMPDFQLDEIYSDVDTAIQKLCLGLLADCVDSELNHFLSAVSKCSNIIWSSRTSLCKSSRIIKNRDILLKLVLQWTVEVCNMAPTILLELKDQQYVVDCLWKSFESLPFSTAPQEVRNAELEYHFKESDILRRKMILVDIFSRWPSVNAFSVLHETKICIDNGFGSKLVVSLCRLFFYQVTHFHDSVYPQKTKKLLSALLSDIHELNQHCFGGALPLSYLFPKHLLKLFLLRRDAPILGEFFELVANDAIEAKEIWKEAVCCFGRGGHQGGSLKASIDCLDVLLKWLPELRDKLLEMRRCHEAAFHIAEVLLPGKDPVLRPEQIQAMDALSVFDFILEKNPSAIVLNCVHWEDPTWAKETNNSIRNDLAVNNAHEPTADQTNDGIHYPIPPLPGQALFYLAQILGLDVPSMTLVKSKVVNVALAMHFYGASAAVCRSLIADCTVADVDTTPALWAVSKIVIQPDFDDALTKRELCLSVLALPVKSLYPQMIEPITEILNTVDNLDHLYQFSTLRRDSALVSVSKLYQDTGTLNEGSADMTELFSSLNRRLVTGIVDDALIAKLARYIIFWCIEQASQFGASPFQTSSTRFVIVLAASLVLHIRNINVSKDCLRSLMIAVEENVNDIPGILNSTRKLDGMSPDPRIVKGLIGRGYTENGARRSALAVQNIGFSEALQWAVSHSFDPGFDDPMVALRSEHVTDIDFENSYFLKKVLAWIESILFTSDDESVPVSVIGSEVKWNISVVPIAGTVNIPIQTKATNHASIDSWNVPVFQNGKAPAADNERESQTISTKESSAITTASPPLAVNVVPVYQPARHVNTPSRERFKESATVQKNDEPSPDRSVLLQVGQEAFQTAQQHRPTSSPSRAERMRLIEEGRRLLQQARSLSSDTVQRRFFTQSASTTPTSSYVNGKDTVPQLASLDHYTEDIKDSVIEPSDMVLAPSTDVADEWDFDDENFDLEDD
jgi:hypothetical protein